MEEMMSLAATTAGWVGALGTAAAYGLVSRRVVEPDSATFQTLNLSGAALLGVSAAANGAWPAVAANFVWVLISVMALVSARGVLDAVRGRLCPRRGDGDQVVEPGVPPYTAATGEHVTEPLAVG